MNEPSYNPDTLSERLDELLPPGSSDNFALDDADPLIQTASRMASMPVPQLSAEAVARIKAKLPPVQQPVIRPTRWRGVVTSFATAAAAVILVVVVGFRSLDSVPGDALYSVKQAVEQTELSLASNHAARASVYLNYAERRADEYQILLSRGKTDPALLESAAVNQETAVEIASQLDAPSRIALVERSNHVAALIASIEEPDTEVAVAPTPTIEVTPVPTEEPTILVILTETPTQQVEPSPVPPTLTSEPTATPVPPTVSPTLEPPTVTPNPFADVNIAIEGEIEEVRENSIIVYGFEIAIKPDDPLRPVLREGDIIRIEGAIIEGGQTLVIDPVDFEFVDVVVELGQDGQVWRDDGNCSNPPPAWANANGWRQRCQGAGGNSNSGGGNNGNNNGSNGNNGNGRGNRNSNRGS